MAHETTYARHDAATQRLCTAKLPKTTRALVFLGIVGWCLMRGEIEPV